MADCNIKKIKTLKIKKDNINIVNEFEDTIVVEHNLKLIINEKIERNVICYNSSIKEFIYGHLYTENYINSILDVSDFFINDENTLARIKLNSDCDKNLISKPQNVSILTTGYRYIEDSKNKNDEIVDKKLDIVNNVLDIMKNSKFLLDSNELFKETGCLHSAGLAFNNEILYYETDLGRHNAVDKVIGCAMLDNKNIEESVLYTTGRIPTDMIKKVIRSKIKMVITRAAVTYDAIRLARENNIKLIGFSRGDSVNIYS